MLARRADARRASAAGHCETPRLLSVETFSTVSDCSRPTVTNRRVRETGRDEAAAEAAPAAGAPGPSGPATGEDMERGRPRAKKKGGGNTKSRKEERNRNQATHPARPGKKSLYGVHPAHRPRKEGQREESYHVRIYAL